MPPLWIRTSGLINVVQVILATFKSLTPLPVAERLDDYNSLQEIRIGLTTILLLGCLAGQSVLETDSGLSC